jgi:glycosyltransferase involved in cell wall biosynthesis
MAGTPGAGADVSVILPTLIRLPSAYAINLLDRAIRSVQEQNYPGRFEIVLVDDASPEPVAQTLDSVGCRYRCDLRVIRLHRQLGLVQALNCGLLAAQYGLIARIDADDFWLPGKIERQLARFATDPELSIVGTGMRLRFEDGRPPEDFVRPDGWSPILRFFSEVGCPFPHGSIVARRDIYRLLGGYPQSAEYSHCEDFALWSAWIRFFKPARVEEVLYVYSVSPGSISSIHAERNRRISAKIKNDFACLDIAETTPETIGHLASVLGLSLLQAGAVCYRLWHYRPAVTLPEAAVAPLRRLLADRTIRMAAAEDEGRRRLQISDLLDGFGSPPAVAEPGKAVVAIVS